MKKWLKLICILLLVFCSYLYGILSTRKHSFPFPQVENAKLTLLPEKAEYSDTSNKQEVDCTSIKKGRLMVALAFGQSNSANCGEKCYTSTKGVYNFFRGKCYKASDPLLGADGLGGSVWTMLGDKIIDRGLFDNVLFIPIGVSNAPISRWAPGGNLHQRIINAIDSSKAAGFTITHIFWHQGESDARDGTPKEEYKKRFMEMLNVIRGQGVEAPIYISKATRLRNMVSNKIRDAQAELIDPTQKIYPGPDTDTLDGLDDRYDGVHFSEKGQNKVADLWLSKITKTQ